MYPFSSSRRTRRPWLLAVILGSVFTITALISTYFWRLRRTSRRITGDLQTPSSSSWISWLQTIFYDTFSTQTLPGITSSRSSQQHQLAVESPPLNGISDPNTPSTSDSKINPYDGSRNQYQQKLLSSSRTVVINTRDIIFSAGEGQDIQLLQSAVEALNLWHQKRVGLELFLITQCDTDISEKRVTDLLKEANIGGFNLNVRTFHNYSPDSFLLCTPDVNCGIELPENPVLFDECGLCSYGQAARSTFDNRQFVIPHLITIANGCFLIDRHLHCFVLAVPENIEAINKWTQSVVRLPPTNTFSPYANSPIFDFVSSIWK